MNTEIKSINMKKFIERYGQSLTQECLDGIVFCLSEFRKDFNGYYSNGKKDENCYMGDLAIRSFSTNTGSSTVYPDDLTQVFSPELFLAGILHSELNGDSLDENGAYNSAYSEFEDAYDTVDSYFKECSHASDKYDLLELLKKDIYRRTYYDRKKFTTGLLEMIEKSPIKMLPLKFSDIAEFSVDFYRNNPNISSNTLYDVPDVKSNSTKKSFSDYAGYYFELYKKLRKDIIGQDVALQKFLKGLYNAEISAGKNSDMPYAVYLLAGPPGVGKSFLAGMIADELDRPCKIFPMTEYTGHNQSHEALIGISSFYSNSHKGLLTSYVEDHPNAVLVFDEIEKAGTTVLRLFLSVLEGAYLETNY